MGPNLAISVNWAKGHSDVLNSFTASTCINPCEWTEVRGLKPALFLPWKNPILSFAPPTRCESPLPECAGKAGPWITDKSYAQHYTKIHGTKAPLRVIFILIQSFTVLIYDFFKDCSVPGCREKTIMLQHHIRNQHSYALPPPICRLCRQIFRTEVDLEKHWKADHQDKDKDKDSQILCKICHEELLNNFEDCLYHTC